MAQITVKSDEPSVYDFRYDHGAEYPAAWVLPAVISKKYGVCRETVYRYRREAKDSVTISRNMLTPRRDLVVS